MRLKPYKVIVSPTPFPSPSYGRLFTLGRYRWFATAWLAAWWHVANFECAAALIYKRGQLYLGRRGSKPEWRHRKPLRNAEFPQ